MIAMILMVMMILITIIHLNKVLILENQKENLLIEGEMKVQAMKKSIETHQDLIVVVLVQTLQVHYIDITNITKA